MANTYRKRRGVNDTWHFCANCSDWPIIDYEEHYAKPNDSELCEECKARKETGTCS
jgi:hypothetical protein